MNFYRKKKSRFGFAIAAGVLVFLLTLFLAVAEELEYEPKPNDITDNADDLNEEKDTMRVHFLDVDQGLCILVQLGDKVLVYDGGERDTSSFVVAYLKKQGITEIDYLISSHYDADHTSGLIGCLYAFDVEQVIGSNYVHDSKTYTSFYKAVEQEGVEVQYPAVGTQYPFGDAVITILAPKEIVEDSNSNSVVVKLTYGESDFIFTGDADYASEQAMLASGISLDCEVLSVGHHGSASATSEAFLAATTPEYAVISCGKENEYGHPHKETLEHLKGFDVEVFRNDEIGTIIVETDGTNLVWR